MKRQDTILITGGAGYIGSHMVKYLTEQNCAVVVLDNLSNGSANAVHNAQLIVGDLADTALLNKIFKEHKITAVMHFAAYISVAESVANPEKYYQNNTCHALNLLGVMQQHGIKHFIFSSTAAIFGNPEYTPIDTEHPKNPINAYGRSKWLVEQALVDYEQAYGLRSICLRYFNAAGADPDGSLGDFHEPAIHIIPLVLLTTLGKRKAITLYGDDYNTPDGSCVRDYIHVTDLCQAHWLALQALQNGAESTAYNLGNGNGYSVKEVIEMAQTVTGKSIPIINGSRREGDPAVLIADSTKIKHELGWQPKYPDLKTIIEHSWQAFQKFQA